jgi:hypothetical protein
MKLRQGVQRSDFQQPLGRLCVTSVLLYHTPGKISSGVLRKTKDVASFIYSLLPLILEQEAVSWELRWR